MCIQTQLDIFDDPELDNHEKLVLVRLALYQGQNDSAYPSLKTLAAQVSLSVRKVRYVLASLQAKGRIVRVFRSGRATEYHLKTPAQHAAQPRHSVPHTPAQRAAHPGTACRTPRHSVPPESKREIPNKESGKGAAAPPFPKSIWEFRGGYWDNIYRDARCRVDDELVRTGFLEWVERTGKPITPLIFYNYCKGENERRKVA